MGKRRGEFLERRFRDNHVCGDYGWKGIKASLGDGNQERRPQVGRLGAVSWEIICGAPTMGGKEKEVGIYIGLKNLESLAAQAGNCEKCMMNVRDLRCSSWVSLVRRHGFSFTYSGVVEIIWWKETSIGEARHELSQWRFHANQGRRTYGGDGKNVDGPRWDD